MDNQSRCWLVVASVSPLAAAFSIWTLATFHAYRRQWRTVDVLFVAAVSQELVHSLFLIGHSVLNITQPNIISICSLFIWATVSIRTFQVATLTTLVLDRTFTLLWPYRYRLTVRRHQVRYHLVAMTIVSSLVGVASIFAQNPPSIQPTNYTCYLLPFDTDPEFAIFIITLHGVLSLVTFGGIIYVQIKQCLAPKTVLYSSPSSTMTTTSTAGVDRIRIPPKPYLIMDNNNLNAGNNSTLGGSSSDRGRHWMSMRREPSRIIKEFRWGAVLPIAITCHFVNIFPYLVMVGLARFTLLVPPLWLEGGSTYLALVQALLLPALLWGIDPIYKTAVTHTLVRKKQGKSDKLPEYTDNGSRIGSGCQQGSLAMNRSINFDTAVAYSTFVCSSDTLDKKELLLMQSNEGSRWGTATQDELNVLTSFYHPKLSERDHCLNADLRRMNDHHRPLPEPVYCDPAEMVSQGGGGGRGEIKDSHSIEDHIYATVSDRYDKSTLSVKADPRRLTEEDNFDVDDEDDLDEEDNDDVSSVTTSASDDFEFHLTRPRLLPHTAVTTLDELPNRLRCSVMNHNYMFKNSKKDIPAGNTPSRTSTLSIRSGKADDDRMIAGDHSSHIIDDNELDYLNKRDSLSGKQKSASLSMNDLDLLSVKTEESTEELVYVLTGRSESNLSLYKITSCEDSETLDRPFFRYANRLASRSKPELCHQNSSRYSTWSLQEPDAQLEWDVATQDSAATEPVVIKHPLTTTRTLDPLLPANAQNVRKKSIGDNNDGSLHKYYCSRNPFLVKNRIRSNSRSKVKVQTTVAPSAGIYSSTNWKYRANNPVNLNVQRQDFPWKNKPGHNGSNMLFPASLALPYHFPIVNTRQSSSNKSDNNSNSKSSASNKNNSGNSRVIQAGGTDDGLSYQRKFVSDFL
ncbi:hypothetical protein CHUAL_012743 [Chamberlinius hualienensis]